MEIWDSLNQCYLDFIKKRGPLEKESWIFQESRASRVAEPVCWRVEELASRTDGLKDIFIPKKGKAGKKSELDIIPQSETRTGGRRQDGREARRLGGKGIIRSSRQRKCPQRNLRRPKTMELLRGLYFKPL